MACHGFTDDGRGGGKMIKEKDQRLTVFDIGCGRNDVAQQARFGLKQSWPEKIQVIGENFVQFGMFDSRVELALKVRGDPVCCSCHCFCSCLCPCPCP